MYAIVLRDLTFITQTNSAFAALITLQTDHSTILKLMNLMILSEIFSRIAWQKNCKSALPTPKKGGQYTPK